LSYFLAGRVIVSAGWARADARKLELKGRLARLATVADENPSPSFSESGIVILTHDGAFDQLLVALASNFRISSCTCLEAPR
jgi:hypothetical protein